MPESYQSSLLNRSQWVSEWVSQSVSHWQAFPMIGLRTIKKTTMLVCSLHASMECVHLPLAAYWVLQSHHWTTPMKFVNWFYFGWALTWGGCLFNFWFWIIFNIIRGTTFETFWFESSVASCKLLWGSFQKKCYHSGVGRAELLRSGCGGGGGGSDAWEVQILRKAHHIFTTPGALEDECNSLRGVIH